MELLLLVVGLGLVLLGAELLVDGASAIAHRFGLSEFVIGMFVVGIGTSAPEMVVSFIASIRGIGDVAIGNIVGSNIANTFLILGVASIVFPISLTDTNIKRDIPMGFLATLLLFIFCSDTFLLRAETNTLDRIEGGLLLLCFVLFILFSFRTYTAPAEAPNPGSGKKTPVWKSSLFVLAGLAALISGGKVFVENGMVVAKNWGMSDAFIGITVMAVGTSLPELAASVVAAVKKKGQMILGNIVGSNIVNILLILGGSALINPLTMRDVTIVDMLVLILTMVALAAASYTFRRKAIDRFDGLFFVIIYVAYITWLTSNL